MIGVIERLGLEWENGELKKWRMEYLDYKGTQRTYSPDFILENKYMIECKPKKLWNSDSVIRKKEAAIEFCEKNNLIYKLRDNGCLSEEKIVYLRNNKLIKFTDRYEKLYQERFT